MVIKKMTLDDYLFSKGVGFVVSDYTIDKSKIPRGLTQRQRKKLKKETIEAAEEYSEKRRKAIEEYHKLVETGEISVPTILERRIRTAQGHPDRKSTQAARRLLEKMGIDWGTAAVTY